MNGGAPARPPRAITREVDAGGDPLGRRRGSTQQRTLLMRANRANFESARQLAGFTSAELQASYAIDFRDLAFDDASKERLRTVLREHPPPDDPRFWEVLKGLERASGRRPSPAAETRVVQFLPQWIPAGNAVRRACHLVRQGALRNIKVWSGWYEADWKRGETYGLIEMVRDDGVHEEWVQRTIAELRLQQSKGTLQEQREAKSALQQIGRALWKVGKGRQPVLAEQVRQSPERRAKKREQARVAKEAAALRRRYEKALRGLDPRWHPPDVVRQGVVAKFHATSKLPEALRLRAVAAFQKQITRSAK